MLVYGADYIDDACSVVKLVQGRHGLGMGPCYEVEMEFNMPWFVRVQIAALFRLNNRKFLNEYFSLSHLSNEKSRIEVRVNKYSFLKRFQGLSL